VYQTKYPSRKLHLVIDEKIPQQDQSDSIVLKIPTDTAVVQQATGRFSIPQASLFDKPE
jgi:hypothetical protein